MLRVVLAVLLLTTAGNGTEAGIVAVGPNPVAQNDRGEYVVLSIPAETNLSEWSIADGESVVRLPDRPGGGRIAVTTEPSLVEPWLTAPVVGVDGRLALANAGERLELRRNGKTVDSVTYRRAPEGHRYVRINGGWEWRHEGTTDLPVVRAGPSTAEVFVLPDAPNFTERALATARDRILLGAYTFASRRAADALCRARKRGVTVRLVVDSGPVGGMSHRAATVLDSLSACGVGVTVLGGPYDRYEFHHAKYAVIDDTALVMTENWKPSGSGGRSNRGWGVIVNNSAVADGLAATFRADTGWRDAIPWDDFRRDRRFAAAERANGTFRPTYAAATVNASGVSVLVTPDNAESALIGLFDNASDSLDVQQVSIGGTGTPLFRAVIRAARRGVRVRILLANAWYVREDNRAFADRVSSIARREDLQIEVRLANPAGRFGTLHSKGIIIDRETVVVGSINWNNNSLRRNREVAVVLRGSQPAAYFHQVFLGDWRGGQWVITVGIVIIAVGIGLAAAWWAARSFEFKSDRAGDFTDLEAYEGEP